MIASGSSIFFILPVFLDFCFYGHFLQVGEFSFIFRSPGGNGEVGFGIFSCVYNYT